MRPALLFLAILACSLLAWFLYRDAWSDSILDPNALEVSPEESRQLDAQDDTTQQTKATQSERERLMTADSRPALESKEFLARLGGIRGRFVDSDDKPIANMQVQVITEDMGVQSIPGLATPRTWWHGTTTTAADGVFQIAPLWHESGTVRLTARRGQDWIYDSNFGASLRLRQTKTGEIVDLGDLEAKAPAALVGRIVDSKGQPVAGARIHAQFDGRLRDSDRESASAHIKDLKNTISTHPMSSDPGLECDYEQGEARITMGTDFSPILGRTTSNKQGEFALRSLPQGRWLIGVSANPQSPPTRFAGLTWTGEETDLKTLKLSEGYSVRGVVQEADGRPIPGARIRVLAVGKKHSRHVCMDTGLCSDANGAFKISHLRSPRFALEVRRNGDSFREMFGDFDSSSSPQIVLRRKQSVSITVYDADNAPTRDFQLQVFANHPWEHGLHDYSHMQVATSLVEQKIQLAPGDYWLLARGPGDLFAAEKLSVQESDTSLSLHLSNGPRLKIRVTDAAGHPIPAARAAFCIYRETNYYERQEIQWTDKDGRASVPAFATGAKSCNVAAPGYVSNSCSFPNSFEPGTIPNTVEITLRRRAELTIQVKSAEPLPRRDRMVAKFKGPDKKNFSVQIYGGQGSLAAREGEYKLVGLTARRYYGRLDIPSRSIGNTVRLQAYEDTKFTIELDESTQYRKGDIQGTVDFQHAPWPKPRIGVSTSTNPRTAKYAKIKKDGTFLFKGVDIPRGYITVQYYLNAKNNQTSGTGLIAARKFQSDGKDLTFDFRPQTGSLSANLFLGNGSAAKHHTCWLVHKPDPGQHPLPKLNFTSNSRGELRIPFVIPGRYELAYRLYGAPLKSATFEIRAGQETAGIRLSLAGVFEFRGTASLDGVRVQGKDWSIGFSRRDDVSEFDIDNGVFKASQLETGVSYQVYLSRKGALKRHVLRGEFPLPKNPPAQIDFAFSSDH